MVHTRSHDMSADIFTKGFLNKTLFRRLKLPTNMCTLEELEKGWLNPPALNDKGEERPEDGTRGLNTQYGIILSGPSSAKSNKKAIKQKTKVKAKSKAKHKKNCKPRPQVQAFAALADKVGVESERAQWFLRVDYGATHYVRNNDDSHCPLWPDVKRRRTFSVRNGEPIMGRQYHP